MTYTIDIANRQHQMPFGAQMLQSGEALFRLWAPTAKRVELCVQTLGTNHFYGMQPQGQGWFAVQMSAGLGCLYCFRIDGRHDIPDPASRYQPNDVHGSSQLIDPLHWSWRDLAWRGRPWHEAVIYELHVGTFTAEGSFLAIIDKLDYLLQLGVTAIQLMPIADFPGQRNWGYDGVLPFAPDSCYGKPDHLKLLVQSAHDKGLMVFLDVVYNHLGPEGNYLHLYADAFFDKKQNTPWGKGFNFDGKHSHWTRQFFIHNALYWLEEFNLDGLRLDAVQAMLDHSAQHVLDELASAVKRQFGDNRHIHLILENDDNAAHFLRRDGGGRPQAYTAQWNDDCHHALHVLLTGETSGYYQDFADQPSHHLSRSLTEGFAYQGEASAYRQGKPRGEASAHLPPLAFINFLQNHDQIGNRPFGERLHALVSAAAMRAVTAFLLLAPFPPMLFMGQEWGSKQAFNFFCDFEPALAKRVNKARRRGFADLPGFETAKDRHAIADVADIETFHGSILDWVALDSPEAQDWLSFHSRVLELRRLEIIPRLQGALLKDSKCRQIDGQAIQVCWTLADGVRLSISVNFGEGIIDANHDLPGGRVLFVCGDIETFQTFDRLSAWSLICRTHTI